MINDHNYYNNQPFVWSLDGEDTKINTPMIVDEMIQPGHSQITLSNAELYDFLLGDETRAAHNTDSSGNQSISGDSSSTGDELSDSKRKIKKNKSGTKLPPSSVGRLDFRPINDNIPDSQLKSMTSKERRQLRNKISARNFRNRRKEYMGNLEDELNEQKQENSQLKLEITWMKSKMEKLQKENDQLRLELILNGIILPQQESPETTFYSSESSQNETQDLSSISTLASPYFLESTSLMNSNLNVSNLIPNEIITTPPSESLFTDFPDNWDFALPIETIEPTTVDVNQSNNDTYLSHALLPSWNINQVLSKETSNIVSSPNLIHQYPLLAPALMSIVIAHTMTMSTDELLATSKITYPTANSFIFSKPSYVPGLKSEKDAQAVWDILEPLRFMNDRNKNMSIIQESIKSKGNEEKTEDKEKSLSITNDNTKSTYPNNCLITWLGHNVCRALCEVVATITSSETYSNNSNLITKEQTNVENSDKKFILCRKLQQAKRYISAA